MAKRINGQLVEYITDREKGTTTVKRSGCLNPNCDDVNCAASAPSTMTFNLKTGEATGTLRSLAEYGVHIPAF